MPRPNAHDTRFRTALQRIAEAGQLLTYSDPVDTHLEVAGIMKQLDGQGTLFFSAVKFYDTPVVGNLLCSKETCEAAFRGAAAFCPLRLRAGRDR
jgi:2,5-furandicarboxylate decarboxylase 1